MGERGVGKTEILKNLSKINSSKFKIITPENVNITNEFNDNNNIIEGISLEFTSEEKEYLIKIWNYCYISDTRLINDFMHKADAFIIVYSIIDKNSFNNIQKWINELKENSPKDTVYCFIGNKSDLIDDRMVAYEEIKDFVKDDLYYEVSSKNGNNVSLAFEQLVYKIIEKQKEEEDNPDKVIRGLEGRKTTDLKGFENDMKKKKKCC